MPTPKEIIAEHAAEHMPRPAHNMFAHAVLRALTAAGYTVVPIESVRGCTMQNTERESAMCESCARLQDAKRRALAIADERAKEANALVKENDRLKAKLRELGHDER